VPKTQSATGRMKKPEMASLQSITAWWRRWKAEHDRRLTLDQDGVVKVNYGKFGHPLAEVKAVTGGVKDDE